MTMDHLIVVADASALINFLKIDRIDLIARHSFTFFITDHVSDEVTRHYASQRTRLKAALEAGILREHSVEDAQDVALFGSLKKNLGSSESSAIAFASQHSYGLAIDDGKAIKVAREISKDLKIFRTSDLLYLMIKENIINIQEADKLKQELEIKHGFKMPFSSFANAKSGCSV